MTSQPTVSRKTEYATSTPVVSIDYDEFNPLSYRGVMVHYGDAEKTYCGGNPTADLQRALGELRGANPMLSSSVDHFTADLLHLRDNMRDVRTGGNS